MTCDKFYEQGYVISDTRTLFKGAGLVIFTLMGLLIAYNNPNSLNNSKLSNKHLGDTCISTTFLLDFMAYIKRENYYFCKNSK